MLPVFHRGDVVRKLRQAQGWRQGDLAHRAGLSLDTVVALEKNAPTVTLDSLAKVAGALNVSLDYLLHVVDVTSAVTPGGHPAPSLTPEAPMPETAKAQLLALVQTLSEPEAAIVMPHLRQFVAALWQRQAEGAKGKR